MQKTKNYSLNLPEPDDYVIIEDLNFNAKEVDKLLKGIDDALKILSTDGVSLKDLLLMKADLGADRKVPIEQLPDLDVYKDVLMYDARGNFPSAGNDKKLYVDKATGKIYRWTGSAYEEISKALEIGVDEGTAFDGARGKALEDKVGKMYTKEEMDTLLAEFKKRVMDEVVSDVIEQVLLYSDNNMTTK